MLRDLLSDLCYRLRAIIFRSRFERELDDELRFHIAYEAEQRVRRGESPGEAARHARAAFGGVEQIKETSRDNRGVAAIEQLAQDARYAFRSLAKSPAFATAVVFTLALGIAITTAAFSAVNRLVLHSLPFAHEDRLVMIGMYDPKTGIEIPARPAVVDAWQRQARSFDRISTVSFHGFRIEDPDAVTLARGENIPPSLLATLGVRPLIGRPFSEADLAPNAPPVVLLGEGFWRARRGGSTGVLGTTLTLNDTLYTIIGVLPRQLSAIAVFAYTPDFWVPWGTPNDIALRNRRSGVFVVGRLKPGATTANAEAELELIQRQADIAAGASRAETAAEWQVRLSTPSALLPSSLHHWLWVLFGAAGLVMLIVCANVANLQLVRSARRSGEIAVRAALGASRIRLAWQLFVESAMLTVAGCVLGVALAAMALRVVLAFKPEELHQLDVLSFDRPVLFFALGVAAFTSMLCGMLPAWRSSDVRLSETTRGVSAAGAFRRRHWLQSAVVVSQIAVSLVLLVSAGLLLRSLINMETTNPGFSPEGLLELRASPSRQHFPDSVARGAYWNTLLQRVRAVPGVETAVLTSDLPSTAGIDTWDTVQVADRQIGTDDGRLAVDDRWVTADYFQAMRSQLVAGRTFPPVTEAGDPNAIVLGQGLAARLWPGQDPIGKRVRERPGDPWHEVIGVVADQRLISPMSAPIALQAYFPQGALSPEDIEGLLIRVRSGILDEPVAAALRRVAQVVDPRAIAGTVTPETTALRAQLASPRFGTTLLTTFALLTVMLAALGLYAVIAYAVSQRTHEIGIRMALGARQADIMRLVLANGLRLTALGVIGGLVAAFAATRLLGSLLYEVDARDPTVFVTIPAVLVVVALLASYLPARRAAHVDPTNALRHE